MGWSNHTRGSRWVVDVHTVAELRDAGQEFAVNAWDYTRAYMVDGRIVAVSSGGGSCSRELFTVLKTAHSSLVVVTDMVGRWEQYDEEVSELPWAAVLEDEDYPGAYVGPLEAFADLKLAIAWCDHQNRFEERGGQCFYRPRYHIVETVPEASS